MTSVPVEFLVCLVSMDSENALLSYRMNLRELLKENQTGLGTVHYFWG